MPEPSIKASYFKGTLEALDVLGAGPAASVRERLAPIIAACAPMSRLDWVPVSWDQELTRAVNDVGGVTGVRAVNAAAFVASTQTTLLRPLVAAARSIFGLTPAGLVRISAKGWQAGTRHLGDMHVENLTDASAVVLHRALPDVVAGDEVWLKSFCGLLDGLYALTEHTGETAVSIVDGERSARYEMHWRRTANR